MRTTIPLIAIALSFAACDSPQDEREDAMEEVADAVEEAREAGVDLQVVDAATINSLVPPNCTVVGEPMRGKLGDDEMEATYFVTQREDGRVQAHRTRDGSTVETETVTPNPATSVTGVRADKTEDGKTQISVTYMGEDDSGQSYEDIASFSADATRMRRIGTTREASSRTWKSQYLDETLAFAVACANRTEQANRYDIDSDPLKLIEGATITPAAGAGLSVTLPAVEEHDIPMQTMTVDAAMETCDGRDASDEQPVTTINHFLTRDVVANAHECAAQVTEGTVYATMTPSFQYDETNQWLAMFGGDAPLTVKLEYDGTEMSECTKMSG